MRWCDGARAACQQGAVYIAKRQQWLVVLQGVACCSVLWCALQCVALCCSIAAYVLCCVVDMAPGVLQCVAVCCSIDTYVLWIWRRASGSVLV